MRPVGHLIYDLYIKATPVNTYCPARIAAADCAVCAKGFAPGIAYTCRECSVGTMRSAMGLVVAVTMSVFIVSALLLSYLGRVEHDGSEQGMDTYQSLWEKCWSYPATLVKLLPHRAIKIVVTVWQIISQVCHYSLPHKQKLRSAEVNRGMIPVQPYTMVL